MSNEYKCPINQYGVRYFNPAGPQTEIAEQLHLSNAAVLPAHGQVVHIVGQLGRENDGSYPDDAAQQLRLAFVNTEKALHAAGVTAGWRAVFSATLYISGDAADNQSQAEAYVKCMDDFCGTNRPLVTAVVVKQLLVPGALVEMSSQAILGNATML
ncbi:hypothetical protein AYO20_03098 [Fonsecaea nubica]|uniref:Uncharacterized protein n=1 Tax=Fonsecaea nubica TaxID=856822 RepID=A0A178D8P5_9EURO|nr:hypothetical protein AYO20_03098 [Fonsecaea nubica]OAL37591.1 hypothetical protein AYO20_03098 [Fonsecaea nubica]